MNGDRMGDDGGELVFVDQELVEKALDQARGRLDKFEEGWADEVRDSDRSVDDTPEDAEPEDDGLQVLSRETVVESIEALLALSTDPRADALAMVSAIAEATGWNMVLDHDHVKLWIGDSDDVVDTAPSAPDRPDTDSPDRPDLDRRPRPRPSRPGRAEDERPDRREPRWPDRERPQTDATNDEEPESDRPRRPRRPPRRTGGRGSGGRR